jgi:hypothetical protein
MNTERFPVLMRRLYELVGEFEAMFPGRPFTPDGHLVGSIGECIAAHYYGLTLCPPSTKGHDALCGDGRRVQIKATQGTGINTKQDALHGWLLVIKIERTGGFREVFNGPGRVLLPLLEKKKPINKNGEYNVTLRQLELLQIAVPTGDRLTRIVP